MYKVTWCDHEGNLQERQFDNLRDAQLEAASLKEKYDHVAISRKGENKMKYYIWDNDNAVMVCTTDSRKEAFTAILNHLIEANASEVSDPIMWPVAVLPKPNGQMPDTRPVSEDGWSVIRQAQEAYNRIVGFIPMAYPT